MLSPFPHCSVQLIRKGDEIKGTKEKAVVISFPFEKAETAMSHAMVQCYFVHGTTWLCIASFPTTPSSRFLGCVSQLSPLKAVHSLSRHLETKRPFPYHTTRSCTVKNGVGHEMGKLTFLLFHCTSSDNIHGFSSFPSCFPLSLKFSSQKYVQVLMCISYKMSVFCCLLQVGLRAAIRTQTSRKTLTHCVCAEIGFNINKPKQWSRKTTKMPLAMQ